MDNISDQPLQITRAQARARGLSTYFTGKPCKRGHVTKRRISNGCCIECETSPEQHAKNVANVARWREEQFKADPDGYRAMRAKEARDGRKRTAPEKVKARDKQTWDKRDKDAYRAYMKAWRAANREHRKHRMTMEAWLAREE